MYIQKYYKVIRVIKDGDGGATPLYIENVSDSDGEFQLNKSGSPTYTPNLIYRIDDGEWFEYDVASLLSITVPSGSKIYFRGDNVNGFNQSNTSYKFNFTQDFNIGGYLTSLLVLDNFNIITDIPSYSFSNLFYRQSNLLNAKDLITSNIINVGDYGLYFCFSSCTSLTTVPNFQNVTTVDYYGFSSCFYGCTSLTTVSNFNNLTYVGDNGFANCFNGCTSLTTAPNFNNVNSVDYRGFASCFSRCTSLTTAPNFNNVTSVGGDGFYSCFDGCTSLTTAPSFQNITTVGDRGFQNCFNGCTKLRVIYTPSIESWNTSNFSYWVSNVAPTGVMYKPTGLEIPTGTSGVPEGWTKADY
ncbi:MAG: leucine-rich repeat protein [Bacteroidales bacterium]|nr:leucine-rich repeat protein [Bacteroidales bacterium]